MTTRETIREIAIGTPGATAWGKATWGERQANVGRWGELAGWPRCGCTSCACIEPAETVDDLGVHVCGACALRRLHHRRCPVLPQEEGPGGG